MKTAIISIIAGCLLFVVLFYVFQRHLIYAPEKTAPMRAAFHAQDMQVLSLHTQDGLELSAWYKPASDSTKPTVLLLHGNAGHMGYRMPLVRQFIEVGFGVLLLEYRGYGGNAGHPTEQGLYVDARAGVRFLQQAGVAVDKIVLYGESLGTAVATQLATEYPACALVLQSPFTSLEAVGRYHYPWAIFPPIDKFDSLARIKNIHMPLLILHGTQDNVVPFIQGQALFKDANAPKQFITLPDKGHSNLWDSEFVHDVNQFISSACVFN